MFTTLDERTMWLLWGMRHQCLIRVILDGLFDCGIESFRDHVYRRWWNYRIEDLQAPFSINRSLDSRLRLGISFFWACV